MKTISHPRTVRSGTTANSLLHRSGKLLCLPANAAGAVKITLDLHPTTMSFDFPWHFLPDGHHVGIAINPTRP